MLRKSIVPAGRLQVGDRLPSNKGTFTIAGIERGGRKIVVETIEQTPEGTHTITFSVRELVGVER